MAPANSIRRRLGLFRQLEVGIKRCQKGDHALDALMGI